MIFMRRILYTTDHHTPILKVLTGINSISGIIVRVSLDIRLTLDDIIIEGDRAVNRGTYSGTNNGVSPGMGVSTGKQVHFTWCGVTRYDENGKIAEVWMYWEQTSFNQQLGFVLHPPISENTFARVTVTRMKPERMQEGVDLYRDSVVG